MAEQTGVPIYADTAALSRLSHDLIAAAPLVWAECRLALREAGEVVAADARNRASYSDKIPGSIKVATRGAVVKVRAGGDAAPNAAPLENKGRGNPRHPLFGNRNYWYTNTGTPAFLAPALDAKREVVAEMIATAVGNATDRAIRESH